MAKFPSPPAGPLAAGLESDFCRCRLEVLHVFSEFHPSPDSALPKCAIPIVMPRAPPSPSFGDVRIQFLNAKALCGTGPVGPGAVPPARDLPEKKQRKTADFRFVSSVEGFV